MNLNLSLEDENFRQEAAEFLNDHLTKDMRESARLGAGVWADFDLAMRWQKILYANGRIAPNWPKEYGGWELSVVERYLWQSECAKAGTPRIPVMGLSMCGPVLMKYGTPEQKEKFLPRILSGEDFWCQGYSEPGSGSDLASLQCKAERDGDEYVINGTKIWTTYAQYSNWIFCLVRTDNSGKPQQGISFVLIPMDAEGVTQTPIITLAGDHEVNQVFFDNVRIPIENLVGEENDGWTVAKYLLEHERGGSFASGMKQKLNSIKQIAAQETHSDNLLINDPDFNRKLADAEIRLLGVDTTEQRIIAGISDGSGGPGAPSTLKLMGSEVGQMLDELALQSIALYAHPDFLHAREGRTNWSAGPNYAIPVAGSYLNNRASTIYGGSSEVQRNILSKVLFGL